MSSMPMMENRSNSRLSVDSATTIGSDSSFSGRNRPAFSNLSNVRNVEANTSLQPRGSLSSVDISLSETPQSSNRQSSNGSTSPDSPELGSSFSSSSSYMSQSSSALTLTPNSRYVRQCRSIINRLQLTPSNFKQNRKSLMRSPLDNSREAAERRRNQELLESIYHDSLAPCSSDGNGVSSSEGEEVTVTPVVKKVAVQARVNKARRRFRF